MSPLAAPEPPTTPADGRRPTPDWTARMITADVDSAPLLRTRFDLDGGHGELVSAVLRATAFGVVEACVNGEPASPDVLAPGWTAYERRLRYAEWDVTHLITSTNVVVLSVGNGWFRGSMGWMGHRGVYGPDRAAAAELHVLFGDGHRQVVITDLDWHAAPSGILSDDWYEGQVIDARLPAATTAHTGAQEGWGPVRVVDFDPSVLERYTSPPVRRQEQIAPSVVSRTADGHLLLDFGQNVVGWLRVPVRGVPGSELVVRHAEVLVDGDLAVRQLRLAPQVDRFVLSGGDDVFEPTFTYHGFRYARIEGWQGTEEEAAESLRAVVIGSDIARIGDFSCSDSDLNRLHENIVWSLRGNFVDVPTDCPQRDERMGYAGDLTAFAPTAVFLYDLDDFLTSWMRDFSLETEATGNVPIVVPEVMKYLFAEHAELIAQMMGDVRPGPVAFWQDASVWVPWTVWEQYGDRRVLEQAATLIAFYLDTIETALDPSGALTAGRQIGDWLDPAAPRDDAGAARADSAVVATACVHRSFVLAARMSRILGDEDESARREAVARRIRDGFRREFVDGSGRIRSDAPTVYALAIAFDLLPDDGRAAAGTRLAELVADLGHVASTGFVGTPFILQALADTGHTDAAYRMLLQRDCPSWLYQVSMGATTVWERWDALLPDGTVNPADMVSFNHFAFASVGDFLHRVVAGISPLEPGYGRVLFAPQPGGGLSSAAASISTRFGRAGISWRRDGDRLRLELEVPPGTEGVLRLGGAPELTIPPGRHSIERPLAAS